MRSALYEASTVSKAIEKAWEESGRPDEFSICIYETERRGFLGFSKKVAVVSIVFEPKKNNKQERKPRKDKPRIQSQYRGPQNKTNDNKALNEQRNRERIQAAAKKETRPAKNESNDNVLWDSELMQQLTDSLKDIVGIMGVEVPFTVKVEKHLLKIEFSKPVMDAPSEERMLFASLAYLLMQFIKREHKKGFRGCRIAISSIRN